MHQSTRLFIAALFVITAVITTAVSSGGLLSERQLGAVILAQSSLLDPNNGATQFRGQNGTRYTFACPAMQPGGSAWGTDVYTDDSSICGAAMHAGVLTPMVSGNVTIEIRPGQSSYTASTRNGITTYAWGSWSGSFTFVGGGSSNVTQTTQTQTVTLPAAPTCAAGQTGTYPNCVTPLSTLQQPSMNAVQCSADGTTATLSWSFVPSADVYALRIDDTTNNTPTCLDGWYCYTSLDYLNDSISKNTTSFTQTVIPGRQYKWWVHAKYATTWDGVSAFVMTSFTCPAPTPTNASCSFNDTSVASGASVPAFQTQTVPYNSTCAQQLRTCTNGTLSGTYQYSGCTVAPAPAVSCTPETNSPQTQTVSCPVGQTGTITQQRVSSCTPGAASPTWSAWTTTSNTCVATLPAVSGPVVTCSASSVAPGSTISATISGGVSVYDWAGIFRPTDTSMSIGSAGAQPIYRYVPLPRPANVSFVAPTTPGAYELRLMTNNGYSVLGSCSFTVTAVSTQVCPVGSTGSYPDCMCASGYSGTYPNCIQTPVNASCTFNNSTVANGTSTPAYQSPSVPYGSTCAQQLRTCTNGTLSGTYQYSSCTVAAPTCTPAATETRTTTPCPSGQTGVITESRSYSCPAGVTSSVAGAWTTVSNTCAVTVVPTCTVTPSVAAVPYGGGSVSFTTAASNAVNGYFDNAPMTSLAGTQTVNVYTSRAYDMRVYNGGSQYGTCSAQVTVCAQGQIVQNGVCASASTIMVKRVGADLTTATAPITNATVDTEAATGANPGVFSQVIPGVHTIKLTDVANYNEKVGACTYATGSGECSVSTFTQTPSCDGANCTLPVSSEAGKVTKVAVKYETIIPAVLAEPTVTESPVCSADGTRVTLSWGTSVGAGVYALRVDDTTNNSASCTDGWYCEADRDLINDNVSGTTYTATILPGVQYQWWVHAKKTGTWDGISTMTKRTFSCTLKRTNPNMQVGINDLLILGNAMDNGFTAPRLASNSYKIPLAVTQSYLPALKARGITVWREIVPVAAFANSSTYPAMKAVVKEFKNNGMTLILANGWPNPFTTTGSTNCFMPPQTAEGDAQWASQANQIAGAMVSFLKNLRDDQTIGGAWLQSNVIIDPWNEFDGVGDMSSGERGDSCGSGPRGVPERAAVLQKAIVNALSTQGVSVREVTTPSFVGMIIMDTYFSRYYAAQGGGRPNIHIYGHANAPGLTSAFQVMTGGLPQNIRSQGVILGEVGLADNLSFAQRIAAYQSFIHDSTLNAGLSMMLFWRLFPDFPGATTNMNISSGTIQQSSSASFNSVGQGIFDSLK